MINIAPYWVRARHGEFHGWGWSFTSEVEARENAEKKAAQNADWFKLNTLGTHSDWYYADRPMREPILREFLADDGSVGALVTRNSYGCVVLNTVGACFVDVDFPPQKRKASRGILARLFGRPEPPPEPEETPDAKVLSLAEAWVRDHPDWGFRIYRTSAGMRLLATHATMDPGSSEVAAVCQALGADHLYQRLCKTQRCFRARLTPKSWRCGLRSCEVTWPCQNNDEVARMQDWIERYEPLCYTHATCRFITQMGSLDVLPELQSIITYHDETSLAHSPLPLA